MTDGAARLCMLLMLPEGLGQAGRRDCAQPAPLPALGGSAGGQAGQRQAGQGEVQAALGEAFAHLTSRDPRQFWTSGQVRRSTVMQCCLSYMHCPDGALCDLRAVFADC